MLKARGCLGSSFSARRYSCTAMSGSPVASLIAANATCGSALEGSSDWAMRISRAASRYCLSWPWAAASWSRSFGSRGSVGIRALSLSTSPRSRDTSLRARVLSAVSRSIPSVSRARRARKGAVAKNAMPAASSRPSRIRCCRIRFTGELILLSLKFLGFGLPAALSKRAGQQGACRLVLGESQEHPAELDHGGCRLPKAQVPPAHLAMRIRVVRFILIVFVCLPKLAAGLFQLRIVLEGSLAVRAFCRVVRTGIGAAKMEGGCFVADIEFCDLRVVACGIFRLSL